MERQKQMLETTGSFIMYTAHFYYVHNAAAKLWGEGGEGWRYKGVGSVEKV